MNRTLVLEHYRPCIAQKLTLIHYPNLPRFKGILDKIYHRQDCQTALQYLPSGCVDLFSTHRIISPNLSTGQPSTQGMIWITLYGWNHGLRQSCAFETNNKRICFAVIGSRLSIIITVVEKYLHIQNRITWERERTRCEGNRGKIVPEDIWFCTVSNDYTFNTDAVRLRRRVIAPYRENGVPKDWQGKLTTAISRHCTVKSLDGHR